MAFSRLGLTLSCLVLLFPFLGGTQTTLSIKAKTTTRAIVVGVSDYSEITDLKFAHRDAEVFAEFLSAETNWKVAPENLQLLTNEEATMGRFHKAMKWLVAESKPKDRAIIYFSGHGDVEGSVGGRLGYLLLHNSPPVDYPLGGACPIEYLDAMIATLSKDREAEVILITDACRSGNLAGSENDGPQLTNQAIGARFGEVVKIMSCAKEQYSLEHEDWGGGRGLFSYHLVNGLIGLADEDEDELIYIYELSDYLRREVRKVSRQYGEIQIPVVRGPEEAALNTIDKAQLFALNAELSMENDQSIGMAPVRKSGKGAEKPDSTFIRLLQRFETSLEQGTLLIPEDGSAYAILQQLQAFTQFDSLVDVATNDLAVALQEEAQVALNSYLTTPSKELSKRWGEEDLYQTYPQYLFQAAELLGEEDFFYESLRSRAEYFQGVNLRLTAEKANDEAQLREALDVQQAALQKEPNTAHILNEIGYLLFLLEDKEKAAEYFTQAAQAAPAWVLPYSNLAETHRKLRNYEKAEAAALKALAIDSNFAMAANNLGLIYFIQERDNEAKAYFEKAIAADSNYAATYYNLGNWHFWYKNYDIAEANLLKYNSLKPKDSQAYQLLGLVYQRWKKLEKSSLAFEESLRIDPTNATTTYNFGVLRYEQKRLEEAIGLFQHYQELEPKDTDVYLMLSYCYAGQGKKELVISTLEQLFVELEYDNLEVLEAREDLVEIRKLPEYKALIKRYFPDK